MAGTQTFMIESTLPTFVSMFVAIYLLGYFVVFRNWAPKHVAEASSCLISLAHGTPVVFMAIHAVAQTLASSASIFASPNTDAQNTVLDYSIAYFSTDLAHYLIFSPTETLFICHHLATLYVFLSCRFAVGHGAAAILVLLVLAEATSACQNAWTLAGFRRADLPAAERLYEFLSPRFYGLYSVLRAVLGPMFVLKMIGFFAGGSPSDVVPMWAWVSWMFVIVTAVLVSVVWIWKRWSEWFEERRRRRVLKMKEI